MTTETKQTRVRCSNEKFLEAVFSSKTYAEVAEKTGQQLASTISRYAKTNKILAEKGESLPEMERKKTIRTSNTDELTNIVRRLKEHHTNS